MTYTKKGIGLLLCSAAFMAADAPASAETAPANAAAEPQEIARPGVDIVVTGRATEAARQHAPITITSFNAEAIKSQNIVEPRDLNRVAPGLNVSEIGITRNGARYTLRGQGQETGAEASVITYFGEVPTTASGPGFLFDLAGIDVFKGPQGTAFGRNSTGGAVVLRAQAPSGQFGGYVDASIGDYDFQRVQAAVDVPIAGDKLTARFAIDANHRRGFTKDIETAKLYDGRDYKAYRAYLIARPFDGFQNDLLVNFVHAKQSEAGAVIIAVNPAGTAQRIFPGLNASLLAQQARGPRLVDHDIDNGYSGFRSLSVSNISSYDVTSTIAIRNIFGYNDNRVTNFDDTDGSPFRVFAYLPTPYPASFPEPESPFKGISDEIQLKGNEAHFNWVAGVFYEHKRPASKNQEDLNIQLNVMRFTRALKYSTSKAIFGQATVDLLPKLKLTGGGRYTWDTRSQTVTTYAFVTACGTPQSIAANLCGLHQSAKFHAATWNGSLQYEFTPNTMLYATVRRGYKSGGFNTTAPTADQLIYQPEHLTDYELGGKTTFQIMDQRAHVNVDLYKSDFSNKQTTGITAVNGVSYTLVTNVGKGSVKGVELDAGIDLFDKLTLSAVYAHTIGKTNPVLFGGVSRAGAPLAGISRDKVSLDARYALFKSDKAGEISTTFAYSYQTRFRNSTTINVVTTADPFRGTTPGYSNVDARIDWNGVMGRPVDVSLYVTNLADNKALQQVNYNFDGLGYDTGLYVPPRMIAGSIRYRF